VYRQRACALQSARHCTRRRVPVRSRHAVTSCVVSVDRIATPKATMWRGVGSVSPTRVDYGEAGTRDVVRVVEARHEGHTGSHAGRLVEVCHGGDPRGARRVAHRVSRPAVPCVRFATDRSELPVARRPHPTFPHGASSSISGAYLKFSITMRSDSPLR